MINWVLTSMLFGLGCRLFLASGFLCLLGLVCWSLFFLRVSGTMLLQSSRTCLRSFFLVWACSGLGLHLVFWLLDCINLVLFVEYICLELSSYWIYFTIVLQIGLDKNRYTLINIVIIKIWLNANKSKGNIWPCKGNCYSELFFRPGN